jgi:hypothetical protein
MIRHDYLPRICDHRGRRRRLRQRPQARGSRSGAHLGADHAARVLRRSVPARALDDPGGLQLERHLRSGRRDAGPPLFLLEHGGALGKGAVLPSNWIADWRRLYRFRQADLKVPDRKFNLAMRIDTLLVDVLRKLPPSTFGGKEPPSDPLEANLAFRNLTRARMVRLSTGQDMVALCQGPRRRRGTAHEGADPRR